METEITLERALEELAQVKKELREAKAQFTVTSEVPENTTVVSQDVTTKTGQERIEYPTDHPHIYTNPEMHGGEPTIRGSGIMVRTIIERMRIGEHPLEIYQGYPHLSLAKIYDAISYYYDHSAEIDEYIRENEEAGWRALHQPST